LCSRGEEDVLDDEMLEPFEQLVRATCVGLRLRGVLADHVERGQLLPLHRVEHLREVPAVARLDLYTPRFLEFLARLVVAPEILEAAEAAYASKPVVARLMNSRLCRPAWMISRAIVFESATSVPTSIPSQRSAHCAEVVRRGSTTIRRAPL